MFNRLYNWWCWQFHDIREFANNEDTGHVEVICSCGRVKGSIG